jgi:hypothetical protein
MPIQKITTDVLNDSAITAAKIADGTVIASDIADGAVTSAKLNSTVDLSGKTVTYRSIVAGDIADGAVTSAKLNSTVDLSGKTVTYRSIVAGDIASDAITTAKIIDSAVTAGKLASTLDLSSKTLTLPSSSVREYQLVEAGTTSNRSLVGDSGWVTHLTVTFTTNQACTVFCHAGFAHGFEEGAVYTHGRFRLDSSATTSELQVFKVGFNINYSFGSHNLHGFFTNVSAGSHTIDLQVRNYGPGTEARMNNFDNFNAGDRMFVLFK